MALVRSMYYRQVLLFRRVLFTPLHFIKVGRYIHSLQPKKLQIGAGTNVLKGWLNTDICSTRNVAFLDATKKLPYKDNTFNYVFSEQLVEHLDFTQGKNFLQECYRVLAPKGRIRVNTPNLEFFLQIFNENKTPIQQRYLQEVMSGKDALYKIPFEAALLNNIFRNYNHKFIYDYKTLFHVLSNCGFHSIEKCIVGESNDINLLNIELHIADLNKSENLVVEAVK